jgi:hypothetical protein
MADTDAVVSSSLTDQPAPVSALEHALAAGDQASYSAARQAERLGKPLEPFIPDSASGQPSEKAADTAASVKPASEPGDPSGHKGNAETRKAELKAEIDALLKQRAELRRETAPPAAAHALPASQPAPKAEGEPQYADFEADPATYPDPYAAWMDARFEWRAAQAEARATRAVEERLQQEASTRELKQRTSTLQSRIDAAVTADPTLPERILSDQFDAVPSSLLQPGDPVSPQNDLAEALLDSEQPTDLMVYLSEQPKELAALLTSASPRAFWRTLGQIEGRMSAPKRTAPKTITDAPTPPPTVGTRHESGSSLDVALKTHDQAAYNAERRRQRLAAMRQ